MCLTFHLRKKLGQGRLTETKEAGRSIFLANSSDTNVRWARQRNRIHLEKIHSETKKKNKKTKTKTKTNDKVIDSCNMQVESCPKKIECLNKCRAARY